MDWPSLLNRARALTSSFTTIQLVTLAGTFVLVVGIIAGSAWYLNAPTYALLFADMDPESAGQVVARLKSINVPYRLDEGGRAVRVQSDRLDEVRLELTSQGMPATGRIGFEIFDRTAFGATEFLEQVNYRRALEGEIARTIATLSEVSSARVHIAMGKDSLFGEARPAKASVVLNLRNQRPLAASSVNGITNLVAASVEGLRPESVVILDSFGRPLARPGEESAAAVHLERQQRVEREMAMRVVALLEPVVGVERVRANVAVTLNPQTLEETEELWDPSTVIRSRQTTADQSNGAIPGLVSGARGNMPLPANATPPAPLAVAGEPGTRRTSEVTNYEVSRTTRHTVQPAGDVTRLSVAVVIDDEHMLESVEGGGNRLVRKPRSAEELQKLQGLIAAAIGADASRGDQVTVENIPFGAPVFETAPEPVLERYAPYVRDVLRVGAVIVLVIAAFLLIFRPLMRRVGLVSTPSKEARPELPAAIGERPRTVADLESEIEAQLDAATAVQLGESRRLPVLTRRVSNISMKDPENVAKLLRGWMTDEERG